MKFESTFDMVGNTPIIKYGNYKNAEIYIKLEGYNPTGSLKDRSAKKILLEFEKSGELTEGKTILDASSGSFGCAIAYFGKTLGFPVEVLVSSKLTESNKKFLELMGAKMTNIGSTTLEGNEYCRDTLVKENPDKYVFCDQLNNFNSPRAHYESTGPEILKDLPDLSHLFISMGSGATLLGAGGYVKENKPDVRVFASIAEPGVSIAGTFKPGDYVSPFIKQLDEKNILDGKYEVGLEESFKKARELANKGIFVGPQGGGLLAAAIKAIDDKNLDGKILIVAGDSGWKNLDKLNEKR